MKYIFRSSFLFSALLVFVASNCEIPDVEEFTENTLELSQSIKYTSETITVFLAEGYSERLKEDEIDDEILKDLAKLGETEKPVKGKDYSVIIGREWNKIYDVLEELVGYTDALASIKSKGENAAASYDNILSSLNGLLQVTGFGTAQNPVTDLGRYAYERLEQIRAARTLEKIIVPTDTVIQIIAMQLDIALENMLEINDVAQSENLAATVHSRDGQRIMEYQKMLIARKSALIDKLILLNEYEEGEFESLIWFIGKDPETINKLGILRLSNDTERILSDKALSPVEKSEKISEITRSVYQNEINEKLDNPAAIARLDVINRKKMLQDELVNVRNELLVIEPYYQELVTLEKTINETTKLNKKLIKKSRAALRAWAHDHSQLKDFFQKKQSLSFARLNMYIQDIKVIKTQLDKIINEE